MELETRVCRKCGCEFETDKEWARECYSCWLEKKAGKERVAALESTCRYWETIAKKGVDTQRLLDLEKQVEELEQENTELRFRVMMSSGGFTAFRGAGMPGDLQQQLPRLIQLCHPDKHGGSPAANEVTAWLLKQRR